MRRKANDTALYVLIPGYGEVTTSMLDLVWTTNPDIVIPFVISRNWKTCDIKEIRFKTSEDLYGTISQNNYEDRELYTIMTDTIHPKLFITSDCEICELNEACFQYDTFADIILTLGNSISTLKNILNYIKDDFTYKKDLNCILERLMIKHVIISIIDTGPDIVLSDETSISIEVANAILRTLGDYDIDSTTIFDIIDAATMYIESGLVLGDGIL